MENMKQVGEKTIEEVDSHCKRKEGNFIVSLEWKSRKGRIEVMREKSSETIKKEFEVLHEKDSSRSTIVVSITDKTVF